MLEFKNFKVRLGNMSKVFQRFRQYKLKLRPRKCVLSQTSVAFWGRTIGPEGSLYEMNTRRRRKNGFDKHLQKRSNGFVVSPIIIAFYTTVCPVGGSFYFETLDSF